MKSVLIKLALAVVVIQLLASDGTVRSQTAVKSIPSISESVGPIPVARVHASSEISREASEVKPALQQAPMSLGTEKLVREMRANPFLDLRKSELKRENDSSDGGAKDDSVSDEGFRWGPAVRQSLMFLGIQHGYAFTQRKTREALRGKFWKDYVGSVKSLHGWADGGRFSTNYISHPMQGSFTGFIQIQNDPKGIKQEFGSSGAYWRSRLKAMAWTAAWSTQFELGPISQASIGNVGLKGKQTYIDIVVTPTIGTAWLVAEDALDLLIIKRIERRTGSFYVTMFFRMILNPTRTMANIFRFKNPWYRDRPRG